MSQSERLTARQKQVLAFVEDRQQQTGFAPRLPGRSRALVVVRSDRRADPDLVRVPLLGRIPAGHPVVAHEEAETLLTLPAHLFRGSQLFALRVHGGSMKGAGILN